MSKYCERILSKRVGLLLLACAALFGSGCAPSASAHSGVSAGINYYAEDFEFLAQYGEWMGMPPYGVVWCPSVDEGWAPFYDGQWIWTSDGWAWDSYEPFGELVYHYGYWYYDYDIGWFWVPGDEWSPARVQWYTRGGYCGWAPLPPPNYYWPDPWDYYDYDVWIVVHVDNFCDDHVGRRAIDQPRELLRQDVVIRDKGKELLRRDVDVRRPPEIQQVRTVVEREIPVKSIAKRNVSTQRQTVQPKRQVTVSRENAQPQREVAAPRQDIQAQRDVTEARQNAREERKAERVTSGQTVQDDRKAEKVESRQPAQIERKTETPARSAQSAPSRAADKTQPEQRSSERTVKRPVNR